MTERAVNRARNRINRRERILKRAETLVHIASEYEDARLPTPLAVAIENLRREIEDVERS